MDNSVTRGGSGAGRAQQRANSRILRGIAVVSLAVLIAAFAAGCGSDSQDKDAPSGTWTVNVVRWKFPRIQPLGRPVNFELLVRNVDQRDIPQLIVTVAGLKEFVQQGGSAANTRPIWLPDEPISYANVTPYNSALATSYNLGPLAAGEFKRYKLPLTPLRRGAHRVGYSLSGDLFGGAKLVNRDETPAAATRTIVIDPRPDFDESVFDD